MIYTKMIQTKKILFALSLVGVFVIANCLGAPTKVSTAKQTTLPPKVKSLLDQANKKLYERDFAGGERLARQSLQEASTFEGHYTLGLAQFRQNKVDDAMASFVNAEKIQPENEQLLLTMGMIDAGQGRVQAAQVRFVKLHTLYPDDPTYAFRAGVGYKELRDFDKAYTTLKKADQPKFEHREQVYLHLGDVCLELKRYDESEAYFAKAGKLNPGRDKALKGESASKIGKLLDEGNELFQKKSYQEALVKYDEACKIAPDSAAPVILASTTLVQLGRTEEAEKRMRKAVEINPKNVQVRLVFASILTKRGSDEAETVIQEGLKLSPDNANLQDGLGVTLHKKGETRRAIEAFDKAVKMNPSDAQFRANYAFALLDDERYTDAKRELKRAQELDPKNADFKKGDQLVDVRRFVDQGDKLFQSKKYDKAIGEYKKALGIRDDLAAIHNALGNAELAKRNFGVAEKHFNKSLSVEADNVAGIQGLARLYTISGNTKKKRELEARLRATINTNPEAALTLGRIKEEEGDLVGAEKYYADLIKRTGATTAQRRLGVVNYKLGLQSNEKERYEEALKRFEAAKKFNKDIPRLDETIAVVKDNIKYKPLLPQLKRAEAYYRAGRYAEALPLFDKVYAKMPRTRILTKIAGCHIGLGRQTKGYALLEEASKQSPDDLELREAMLTVFMARGEIEKAKTGFEKIVQEYEDAYYSWYKLGIIELNEDNLTKSIDYFDKSLIYRPDFSVSWIARGIAEYRKGNRERAKSDFEEALRKDADAELASLNIGVLYFNDNLGAKAEGVFRDLIVRYPDLPDPHYHLSYMYFQKGDLDKAETEARACVEKSRSADCLFALSQVIDKEYAKSRNPKDFQELKSTLQEIVAKHSDTDRAEQARKKLLVLQPGGKVIQPMVVSKKADEDWYWINNRVVIISKSEIRVVDAGSFEHLGRDKSGGNALVSFDGVLNVSSGKSVALRSIENGKAYSIEPVDAKSMAALSVNGVKYRIFKEGTKQFLATDEKSIEIGSFKSELPSIHTVEDKLFLVYSSAVVCFSPGKRDFYLSVRGPISFSEEGFLVTERTTITSYNLSGKKKKEIQIGNEAGGAAVLLQDKNYFYPGRNGKGYIVDGNGKEQWNAPLPLGEGKAFSLFY